MPQSAATLLGLILVAASIGFNMSHWPVVGRMVAQVEELAPVAEAVDALPTSETPAPVTASPPVMPNDVRPVPDVEKAVIVAKPTVLVNSSNETDVPVISRERPLVPIPPFRNAPLPVVADTFDPTIRRLPPVDEERPSSWAGHDASVGNSIPIYPSTGIE